MKLPNFHLSTRITIAAIALVVAGALALMFIEEARLRDVYLSEQRANLEGKLHAEKSQMIQSINTLRQDVLFLSNTPPVSGMVRAALNRGHDPRYGYAGKAWEERLQQIFSAFSEARHGYYQIRFIGVANGGRELVRIERHNGKIEVALPAELQAKGDRGYFKATLGLRAGEVYLSEFSLNREWGVIERPYRLTLRAATPVFTPSGQIFGMVVINMDAARLLESVTLGLPAGVLTYITSMDGGYLLHPDIRRSFGFELGSKDNITADFPLLETVFNPRSSEHLPFQAVAAKTGTQYLAAGRIHFDPGNPARFLLLTYHIPDITAVRQMAGIPATHITGGFMAMLLVSGIALLVLRRTFAPLEQVTAVADKIAAGDHEVSLPQKGSGEIGSLVSAFGSMLDKLSQREREVILANTGLEKRVKTRTIELELAKEELRIAAEAFETQDAIMITDADGHIIRVNQAFSVITGYSPEEVLGKNMNMMNPGEGGQGSCTEMLQQSIRDGSWAGEIFDRRKNGQIYPKWMTVTAVKNERQEITHYVSIFTDITVRKQIGEARLRESEERFRGTLEQAAVGIAHATLDGHFQYVNQKFCKIVGYAHDELLHMSYQEITFPDDLDENLHYMQQLLAGGISTFSMEKRYMRKDRSLVWVNLTVSLLRDADGASKYTIVVIEDITERKQAEALAQQFGNLLQNSFNEIYIFDAQSLYFLLTSEGAEKNLGYSSDELNQLTLLDLCPSFNEESCAQRIASLSSGEQQLLYFEAVFRRKNGTIYPVEVRLQFMESDSSVFMAVVQDITERKCSEHRLRDLSAHLQTVREEEKASVAREIHDNLGSTLTALKMDVYWLADELSANKNAALLIEHIESMSQLLDNAVDVTRRVITDLRPTILDDLGLQAALEWQAGQFNKRTGIQCLVTTCTCDECRKDELDKIQTINLFRIFQESLTNIARHSGASRVEVELQCEDGEVILAISDNGCGLPEGHTVARTSYGMLGMRERAEQLGGRVNFYSPPGGGFSVTVILPLLADNQKEEET